LSVSEFQGKKLATSFAAEGLVGEVGAGIGRNRYALAQI
jgi:hypothetical protein